MRVILSVQDHEDHISSVKTYTPPTDSVTAATTKANNFRPLLDALSAGTVIQTALVDDLLTGDGGTGGTSGSTITLKNAPVAGADLEISGTLGFKDAMGNVVTMRIPAILPALKIPESNQLDTTNTAISNITTFMIANGVNVAEQDLVSLWSAEESYRKTKK